MESASKVSELLDRLRSIDGVRVTESEYRTSGGDIGPYQPVTVGPVIRSVRVHWDGDVSYEPDREYAQGLRVRAADDRVDELAAELLAACAREGASLWYGSSVAGVGCWLTRDGGSRWSRLVEDIRVARMRVLGRPGAGHEERLAQLMALVD